MSSPGASRSRVVLALEKPEIVSVFVVEPTDRAVEIQAGACIWVALPLLPDETTVRTGFVARVRSALILAANAIVNAFALSQLPANPAFVPRLMLMTWTFGWLLNTQSSAATTSAVEANELVLSSTLTATYWASGAIPAEAWTPFEAMTPVTQVPWL